MRKTLAYLLVAFGLFSVISTSMTAISARTLSELIGRFLAGLLFLVLGTALGTGRKRAPAASEQAPDPEKEKFLERLKSTATAGTIGGIALMFIGSGVSQLGVEYLLPGILVSISGWAFLVWGCVNLMRWKGYSGWLGLFAYLLLPGLVILACFPNRRTCIANAPGAAGVQSTPSTTHEIQVGRRYLLTLVPLVLLTVVAVVFFSSAQANISADEWKELRPPGIGFRAFMPGAATLNHQVQETAAGMLNRTSSLSRRKERRNCS